MQTSRMASVSYTHLEAIDIINAGDGDVLMRGNIPTRDFLMPVLDKTNKLRTERIMSHVSLASLPEYPKLLALSDMTVVIKPNMTQKLSLIHISRSQSRPCPVK